MNSYSDSLIAKNLLLQLEFYVKNLSKRGPTDLTLYIENFAAKLMEIYYGYSFLNMNYVSKNIAEIDLLNYNKNHAIQITIENNNSSKIIKSIRSANKYDKRYPYKYHHCGGDGTLLDSFFSYRVVFCSTHVATSSQVTKSLFH